MEVKMKDWLMSHFEVQQGMYFDNINSERDMTYFSSEIIADSIWNYGTIDTYTEDSIKDFIQFCERIGKPCNLYVTREISEKYNSDLENYGFCMPEYNGELVTETWMTFGMKKINCERRNDIQLVKNTRQQNDFLDVFVSAYGGEKTPDKPYGDLPHEYSECVSRSFNSQKFFHFICYENDTAVSVATLCMVGDTGGLYNIGTKPEYERRGFGLAVTNACIDKWIAMNGEKLFLQTETGTGIDDWYERMGFNRIFDGAIYEFKS